MASYQQQQPGYNPQYNNPYAQQAQPPPPPGWQQQGYPQQPPPPMGAAAHNMENGDGDKYAFNFSDRTIRAAFVRKVFILVTVMLGIVATMTAVPFFHTGVKQTLRTSPVLYLTAYGGFLVVYLMLMCCESVRRSFPLNLVMTALLTVSMGYMTAVLGVQYSVESVLLSLLICVICCGSIILFSMQTKHDLTGLLGIAFILGMCLFAFGLVIMIMSFWVKIKFLHMVYAIGAAFLFMLYLAIDIQMIMGGRKFEISPEDHIFAAIQLFIDIVYIFWMLLTIFGSSNN